MIGSLRRVALAVAWTACALVLALGSAGLVAGLSHRPGSAARADLTWAADEAIRPGLAGASVDLATLAADVERLGLRGRTALAALVGRDGTLVASSIAEGSALVSTIDAETTALGRRLGGLPGAVPGMAGRLGADVQATYAGLEAALTATSGLAGSWATLTAGSAAATRLADLLARHDEAAAAAARLGSAGSYAEALTRLATATAALDDAGRLRDDLWNTSDVTVLDEWIARNRALDVALDRLWTAMGDARGTVTPAVRSAIAAEKEAQTRLPPDTRALVVIMADLARGGLNQAVISIEQARGSLAAAVARLAATTGTPAAAPPVP